MDQSNRVKLAANPRDAAGQDRFVFSMESAARWSHTAGQWLAGVRHWVETEAIADRPLTTLSVAFGLGGLTGWLIKRR